MEKRSGEDRSRRQLLKQTSLGVAAVAAFPAIIPRSALAAPGRPGANDRIRVGVIGVGGRSGLLIDQLPPDADIVAVADCYPKRAEDAAAKRNAKWRIYSHHRQLLEQKDIDGVIIGTREFQRVTPIIDACQAGKDIYAEKPLTLYISEGRALVRAVNKYQRVLQVGSQQRSMALNRVACEFVRNGGLGRIWFVQGANYTSPRPSTPEFPADPKPEGLDWDLWLNQCAMRPYSAKIHAGAGSREFGGGEITNWGAHGLDQIQWALGMDETGPVELWPQTGGPKDSIAFRYANGVTVRLEMPPATDIIGGGIFVGDKGVVRIVRNVLRTDPPDLIKNLPPAEEIEKWNRAQWQAQYHMQDWLDCMRNRKKPSAHVEIGQRSTTVCHLANLTRQLGRRLRWDPEAERFLDDDEANRFVTRVRRKGFEIPRDLEIG
jgi:predicted dehydrogenase